LAEEGLGHLFGQLVVRDIMGNSMSDPLTYQKKVSILAGKSSAVANKVTSTPESGANLNTCPEYHSLPTLLSSHNQLQRQRHEAKSYLDQQAMLNHGFTRSRVSGPVSNDQMNFKHSFSEPIHRLIDHRISELQDPAGAPHPQKLLNHSFDEATGLRVASKSSSNSMLQASASSASLDSDEKRKRVYAGVFRAKRLQMRRAGSQVQRGRGHHKRTQGWTSNSLPIVV